MTTAAPVWCTSWMGTRPSRVPLIPTQPSGAHDRQGVRFGLDGSAQGRDRMDVPVHVDRYRDAVSTPTTMRFTM